MFTTVEKINEYAERIKVMAAYLAGQKIYVEFVGDSGTYELIDSPSWNWNQGRYFVA